MVKKPGRMYRSIKQHSYTRREYMGGITYPCITQFIMGNKISKFPFKLTLVSMEDCQIRHNAFESARITENRSFENNIGSMNYRFCVHVYPHNVLRENKQATGAGADRVSQGMRASFGMIIGTAAQVKEDQIIMSVETYEGNIISAKNALRKASIKLNPPCKIIANNGKK